MQLNHEFIQSVIPSALFLGTVLRQPNSWVVDSRKVQQGDVFIALKGKVTDGHNHIQDAIEKGALTLVCAQSQKDTLMPLVEAYRATHTFIFVHDPLEDICALAYAWRRKFSIPVVGITGSAGKTTTKEIVGNILRCHGSSFLLSHGTQNTCIGISLNILKMNTMHRVAIFELGISKRGEMEKLVQLVLPSIAAITSIGHSHMEGLGSLAEIAAEKRAIFDYLPAHGVGIIDGDQPLLTSISYPHPVIKFGKKMINQIQARKITFQENTIDFHLKIYQERIKLSLATENSARVYNALAAAAIAHSLAIPGEVIHQGLLAPVSVNGRFRKCPVKNSKSVIIDDSYNANPESMKAALQAFEQISAPCGKIAVLGDMLELGLTSAFWHRQLGRFLRKAPSIKQVIFVGKEMARAQNAVPFGLTTYHVADWQEALSLLQTQLTEQNYILVKGSLGIKLGKLVDALTA